MAYTLKEVNSVVGCNTFTVAALCSHSSAHCVRDIRMKAFVNMDLMFIATKLTNTCGTYSSFQSNYIIFVLKFGEIQYHVGSDIGLVNSVSAVALGYFSVDDQLK